MQVCLRPVAPLHLSEVASMSSGMTVVLLISMLNVLSVERDRSGLIVHRVMAHRWTAVSQRPACDGRTSSQTQRASCGRRL